MLGLADLADAIAAEEDDLVVVDDGDGCSGDLGLVHGGADIWIELRQSSVDAIGSDVGLLLRGAEDRQATDEKHSDTTAHMYLGPLLV